MQDGCMGLLRHIPMLFMCQCACVDLHREVYREIEREG